MLNFGASKPRVRGGARAPGPPPLDPHLENADTSKDKTQLISADISYLCEWNIDSLHVSIPTTAWFRLPRYFPYTVSQ